MKCITSINLRIVGRKIAEILYSRGLRQGDPLSPYMFIIAIDVLSRMISAKADAGWLKGIKLARSCSTLTHNFLLMTLYSS